MVFQPFTGSICCVLVLCHCYHFAANAARVKANDHRDASSKSTGSLEVSANIGASNPLLNGFAISTDVILDAMSKVPVTAMVNMNKKWDERQQRAVDEWYARDDPHGWAAKSLGFRALEMAFFSLSMSPFLFSDDGCEWMDMQNGVKWELFESAKEARTYRIQFEESFKTKSPPERRMGGFSGDQRLEGAQNFVSNKARHAMRCAVEVIQKDNRTRLHTSAQQLSIRQYKLGYASYAIADIMSEVLDTYGKMTDGKLSEMSLKLASVEFPEAGQCKGTWSKGMWAVYCKDECTIGGKKSAVDSQGRHVVATYDMQPFYQPLFWTQWVMKGNKVGDHSSVEWRMTCVDDVATQISLDFGKTWYTWSGTDNTYYADFDQQEGSTGFHGSKRVTMYSYIQKLLPLFDGTSPAW